MRKTRARGKERLLTFEISSRETELPPGAHHPSEVVEVVSGDLVERDDERAVLGRQLPRVVPLEIVCRPVVKI